MRALAQARPLAQVGLGKAAMIVSEIAANSQSEADLCPYAEGTHNARSWYSSLKHRQRQRELERKGCE